jgi:hypothetical protein
MGLKYASRPSEDVVFRENFINDDYVTDNGGVATGSPTISNGVTMNGSSQLVSYGDIANLGADNFSFNFKVSFTSADTQNYIFSKWGDANNRWYIRRDVNGSIFMFCLVGGVIKISGVSATGVISAANTEYDITISGDWSDTLRFYVDGAASVGLVTTFVNADITNTGPFEIGRANAAYGAFTMKDLTIRNRAITEEEAVDVYENDTFTSMDAGKMEMFLNARSHFDDGSDEVTENIGTAGNVYWGDGAGSAEPDLLEHNGVDFTSGAVYLKKPAPVIVAATTETISVGGLMRLDSLGTQCIMESDNNWLLTVLAGNGIGLELNDGGGAYHNYRFSNTFPQVGQWAHVVGVYDGSEASTGFKIYFNGVEQPYGLASWHGGLTHNATSTAVGIRATNYTSTPLDGAMKFPFAVKQALTPTQIKELSNKAFANLNI